MREKMPLYLEKTTCYLGLFPLFVLSLCEVIWGDTRLGFMASVEETPLGKLAPGSKKAIP